MSIFKSEVQSNLNIIFAPAELREAAASEFKAQMNSWLLAPVEAFIFDFGNTVLIERPFYQALLQLRSILKGSSKFFYSINLSRSLLKQIKADGLERSFAHVGSLADAQKKFGVTQESKNRIDLDFIAPFLKGAKSAFEIQCNTPIRPQKPYIKTEQVENIAIAGELSLSSEKFQGTVILSFPEKVFLQIYENMFQEKQTEITKESEDAAGELLNIIYGAAKIELNKNGYHFPKALPTVLREQQFKVRENSDSTAVVLPFESTAGIFYMEIECEKI